MQPGKGREKDARKKTRSLGACRRHSLQSTGNWSTISKPQRRHFSSFVGRWGRRDRESKMIFYALKIAREKVFKWKWQLSSSSSPFLSFPPRIDKSSRILISLAAVIFSRHLLRRVRFARTFLFRAFLFSLNYLGFFCVSDFRFAFSPTQP